MPASRLLRLPRMLVDRAYMPPPFGRRPGGIASRVSFSAADPRGNGSDVVLLEGTARSQKNERTPGEGRRQGRPQGTDPAPQPAGQPAEVLSALPSGPVFVGCRHGQCADPTGSADDRGAAARPAGRWSAS